MRPTITNFSQPLGGARVNKGTGSRERPEDHDLPRRLLERRPSKVGNPRSVFFCQRQQMPGNNNPAYMLAQAAKCRRLAYGTTDAWVTSELLSLAGEYEAQAVVYLSLDTMK
jgi:hypothetical protein